MVSEQKLKVCPRGKNKIANILNKCFIEVALYLTCWLIWGRI